MTTLLCFFEENGSITSETAARIVPKVCDYQQKWRAYAICQIIEGSQWIIVVRAPVL